MTISDEQEMELLETTSETKRVAIGVILAALYAVLAIVPLSAFIGAASIISFAICIAPIMGIILGPLRGGVFGLMGGVLAAMLLMVMPFNLYLLMPTVILGPAFAGLFVGLSTRKLTKVANTSIPGPFFTAIFLLVIIALFLFPRMEAWVFMTPYALAAVVALILQFVGIEFNLDKKGLSKYLQILPFTFLGAMLDHSMMAMGSVYLLNLDAGLFIGILPLMLIERTIATIVGSIVGFVVLTVLRNELN
ncbi:MAG: hypothetical protein ACXABN_12435 [Candidatus Thorarchaeota archaeon]|jgi:hypothetical protein